MKRPSEGRYKGNVYKRVKPGTSGGNTSGGSVVARRRRSGWRPSPLQFIQYTWTTGGSPITVGAGGYVALLTSYPRGSDEDKRHTGETLTYKVGLDLVFNYNSKMATGRIARTHFCVWLVYDSQPSGTLPAAHGIFDLIDSFTDYPATWKINRDMGHRFVIKRRWVNWLEADGSISTSNYSGAPSAPAKSSVVFNKFVKRLGVRTEWKNTTTGGIGDVSKGALYIVVARQLYDIDVRGRLRVYFKSVGNQ
ncbi:capsid protein [Dragonfly-associated mastrevirus]|uniref:Capsid protein n=1 Tax=Dragonfly-associated mastrevirus TaxID=1249648 RepID=K7RTG0_9GEMI|nr:capsid protein [Dragonfly-associated mastrevirus]YP_010782925.1 capsid protein [Dragonfly-associated mastrevirus]AFV91329.1 capsid protein [Dragonfly-associated mastrevirus]AFV91333.1 capsid protein [Dragonfly-associated mastrevirus]